MRIVGWNCQGGLAGAKRKSEQLLELGPDIAVISECANDIRELGHLRKVGWTGTIPTKGLAVFADPALGGCVDPDHDPTRQYFLPVNFRAANFGLLAVWAMNHRGNEPRPPKGRIHGTIAHYRPFLERAHLLIGDFNDNARWDTKTNPGFARTTRLLGDAGFVNLLYERTDEVPGAESVRTFTFPRFRHINYVIDHAFLRRDRLERCTRFEIQPAERWNGLSDHLPLVVDLA